MVDLSSLIDGGCRTDADSHRDAFAESVRRLKHWSKSQHSFCKLTDHSIGNFNVPSFPSRALCLRNLTRPAKCEVS